MESESEFDPGNPSDDERDPGYWINAFRGTPFSIVVPPFIRFQQGVISLRKALLFLQTAQIVAAKGHPELSSRYNDLDAGRTSRQMGVTFETYFSASLAINVVSEVEHFIGGAVSAALRLHPEKMGGQTFKLTEIIAASSTDELIDRAARSVMNSLLYEKPLEYMKKLAEVLSIDATGLDGYWLPFIEMKARRDIGVHNSWLVNEIYLRKLGEAGIPTSLRVGERAIPTYRYLLQSTEACEMLVEILVRRLRSKWIPSNPDDRASAS